MTGPVLTDALSDLVLPAVRIAHRVIAAGDEAALLPEELPAFCQAVPKVRRQSGAARMVARQLLSEFGYDNIALPRSDTRAPIWPTGIVGSLAHDADIAIATIAPISHFTALGIDTEPCLPLPAELISIVTTPTERALYDIGLLGSRLLFVVKEAVYKALCAIDGSFLEFSDVEVDLAGRRAATRDGRNVGIRFVTSPRVIALAYITQG